MLFRSFSGLAFFVMLNYLRRSLTITLDVDWLYRVPFKRLARGAVDGLSRVGNNFEAVMHGQAGLWGGRILRQFGAMGVGRTWPTGSMALWAVILLLAYLLLYYL